VTATEVTSAAEKTRVMIREGRLANGLLASARSVPSPILEALDAGMAKLPHGGIGVHASRLEPFAGSDRLPESGRAAAGL